MRNDRVGLTACGTECREVLRRRTEGTSLVGGTEVALHVLAKRKLTQIELCVNLGSSPGVQSQRCEGRGDQKEQHGDHMDGKSPRSPLEGLPCAVGSPRLLHPRPQDGSDYQTGLLPTPLCGGHPETKQERDLRQRGAEGTEEHRLAVRPES